MIIGVTGGVGSGKSTVLDILECDYSAFIIEADKVAKDLMNPAKSAFESIINEFGEDITAVENGQLVIDRIKLSKLVFQNPDKLSLLNSIVHPLVRVEILSMFDNIYSKDSNALIVLESAILIEAGYKDLLDSLWFVYADKEIRINRLMQSRGYSRLRCTDLMKVQLSDDEYKSNCDFVIDNSNDLSYVKEQIDSWFKKNR